jgi:hypothetical protein
MRRRFTHISASRHGQSFTQPRVNTASVHLHDLALIFFWQNSIGDVAAGVVPRYAALPPRELPGAESQADARRLVPYWQDGIAPDLLAQRGTLVVAQGNS